MSTDWYAPNQQAVRADESGPAEEGTGGTAGTTKAKKDDDTKASTSKSSKGKDD